MSDFEPLSERELEQLRCMGDIPAMAVAEIRELRAFVRRLAEEHRLKRPPQTISLQAELAKWVHRRDEFRRLLGE